MIIRLYHFDAGLSGWESCRFEDQRDPVWSSWNGLRCSQEVKRAMSDETLDILKNWAFLVFIGVGSVIFFVGLLRLFQNVFKRGLFIFLLGVLWIFITLLAVYLVIMMGMNHASSQGVGAGVFTVADVYTLIGIAIVYGLVSPRKANH